MYTYVCRYNMNKDDYYRGTINNNLFNKYTYIFHFTMAYFNLVVNKSKK